MVFLYYHIEFQVLAFSFIKSYMDLGIKLRVDPSIRWVHTDSKTVKWNENALPIYSLRMRNRNVAGLPWFLSNIFFSNSQICAETWIISKWTQNKVFLIQQRKHNQGFRLEYCLIQEIPEWRLQRLFLWRSVTILIGLFFRYVNTSQQTCSFSNYDISKMVRI